MTYHKDFAETWPLAQEAAKPGPVLSTADLAARVIRQDICDRRGLKWEWAGIDDDVQRDILATWARIIASAAGVSAALEVAERFGGIDGDHHKTWVIDQMVRALTGKGYAAWVADMKDGADGPNTYDWDEGIAP